MLGTTLLFPLLTIHQPFQLSLGTIIPMTRRFRTQDSSYFSPRPCWHYCWHWCGFFSSVSDYLPTTITDSEHYLHGFLPTVQLTTINRGRDAVLLKEVPSVYFDYPGYTSASAATNIAHPDSKSSFPSSFGTPALLLLQSPLAILVVVFFMFLVSYPSLCLQPFLPISGLHRSFNFRVRTLLYCPIFEACKDFIPWASYFILPSLLAG